MPRPKRQARRRRPKKVNVMRSGNVFIPFTSTVSYPRASSPAIVDELITPRNTNFQRLVVMAPLYQEYRFIRLTATVYPFNDTLLADNTACIVYRPAIAGPTSVANFIDATETYPNLIYSGRETVPKTYRIPKNVLSQNPERWFSTGTGSTSVEELQGHLYNVMRAAAITTLVIKYSGIVEFRAPTEGSQDMLCIRYIKENASLEEEIDDLRHRLQQITTTNGKTEDGVKRPTRSRAIDKSSLKD